MKARHFLLCFLLLAACTAHGKERADSLLQRMFGYAEREATLRQRDTLHYVYSKFRLNVERRNLALLPVPSMYAVAHSGKRNYLAENIDEQRVSDGQKTISRKAFAATFPHHRTAMETAVKHLSPNIYQETIHEGFLLSPFNRNNRRYYRYKIIPLTDEQSVVSFKSAIDNTQLIDGEAIMDNATGRILSGFFFGEYDMIKFWLNVTMEPDEEYADVPSKTELTAQFRFLGNRVSAYGSNINLSGLSLADSLLSVESRELIESLRPDTLSQKEERLYDDFYIYNNADSLEKRKSPWRRFTKKVLWNTIGENLLNRIKSNFGDQQQGYFRLNPLLNPLYMGYSDKKGFYYKYDLRASYQLSTASSLMLRLKGGYSLKQNQFYFNIPLVYTYDKSKNAYLMFELGNGNWLKSHQLSNQVIEQLPHDAQVDLNRLPYFKAMKWKVVHNRDLSSYISLQAGIVSYRRSAVEKATFRQAGVSPSYRSTAPLFEVEYRPLGWKGPIISADYERSIRGFLKSTIEYERWEFDAQYIQPLGALRSLSYRAGLGFYTLKDNRPYFLEFTYFRENNIPGGWNDNWSGEFELLPADWYNQSKHYIRANTTYSSPLLLLSRLPRLGHFVEQERIYGSLLGVRGLFPYTEIGYGFTSRFFSMGVFVSAKEIKLSGVGFKFGFELFRDW